MIDAIRSEWIKLTTVTSTWVLAIVAVALPLVVSSLTAAFADDDSFDGFSSTDLADVITGTGLLSALLLGVVASVGITGEFSHLTIRPTFAALPDRWRALLAKPIVHIVITTALMTVIVVAAWVIGSTLATGDQSLDDGSVLASLVGLVFLAVAMTVLGYALGLLVRNTALAICILLLWPLIAEGLIAGLMSAAGGEGLQKWLPYGAGFAMVFPEDSGDSGPATLGRVAGGIYFFAWVIALLGVGLWSTNRRDA